MAAPFKFDMYVILEEKWDLIHVTEGSLSEIKECACKCKHLDDTQQTVVT